MNRLCGVIGLACLWGIVSALAFLPQQTEKREAPSFLIDLSSRPRPSLLKKYFPSPSGRNGMEDYFAAVDRLAPARIDDFYTWHAAKRYLETGGTIDDRARALLARFGELEKTDVLTARKRAIEGLGDIRELVRKGNSKPIETVHPELNVDTLFPEYGDFKSLAKYFVLDAYVAFAEGRSASGTDALVLALTMLNRLPQDCIMSRLVTMMMAGIVNTELEMRLDQLSSNDVRAVLACLRNQREWESGFLSALQAEWRTNEKTLLAMRGNPAKGDLTGLAPDGSQRLFAAIKPGEWDLFVSAYFDVARTRSQAAQELFKGPEQNWFKELKQQGWRESDENPAEPKSLSDAGEQAGMRLTEMYSRMATSEATYRTQIRLLRLHMRILDYKWRMGKLPSRLELAAPPEELQDTFGGGEFQYIPDAYGHYQLFSKGFRNTGRVDLRYRRDPNAPGQVDPGDPPPAKVTSS